MLTRLVRLQVLVFVVIAVLGVAYVGASYAGLDRLVADTGYTVRVRLATSGGAFTNAEVTYRGVAVGKVGALRLTATGTEADLHVDADAPPIPADVAAVVADRSAIGEQYVDLRPRRGGAPYLAAGSVIAERDTAVPLPVDQVLTSLSALADSVPKDSLRTVVDELDNATAGTGPDLRTLLRTGTSFVDETTRHVPALTGLVTDGGTVLRTQQDLSGQLSTFGTQARRLAGALRGSDGDLRALISAVPGAADQVTGLLRDTGPSLGGLLANLLTVSDVLAVRENGVEQLLVQTPKAVSAGGGVLRADGAHFGLSLNFFEPPPCTSGYQGTPRRDGLDTAPGHLATAAHCALPPSDPTDVRGSQNAPR